MSWILPVTSRISCTLLTRQPWGITYVRPQPYPQDEKTLSARYQFRPLRGKTVIDVKACKGFLLSSYLNETTMKGKRKRHPGDKSIGREKGHFILIALYRLFGDGNSVKVRGFTKERRKFTLLNL